MATHSGLVYPRLLSVGKSGQHGGACQGHDVKHDCVPVLTEGQSGSVADEQPGVCRDGCRACHLHEVLPGRAAVLAHVTSSHWPGRYSSLHTLSHFRP